MEACIRSAAQDSSNDTRSIGRSMFAAYTHALPSKAQAFLKRMDSSLQEKLSQAVVTYVPGGVTLPPPPPSSPLTPLSDPISPTPPLHEHMVPNHIPTKSLSLLAWALTLHHPLLLPSLPIPLPLPPPPSPHACLPRPPPHAGLSQVPAIYFKFYPRLSPLLCLMCLLIFSCPSRLLAVVFYLLSKRFVE